MASTYVNDLRLEEIGSGEQSGTWGDTTNTNLELIAEAFSFGTEAITTNADTHTTTIADGASDPGRSLFLKYTGTLDSACTITIAPNTVSKLWFIENGTSGSQNIIISQGSGANITIPPGDTKAIYSDGAGSGAAMVDAFASLSVVDLKVQDDLTVTDDASVGGDLLVSGEVQTANIGFTDGDNAMVIADGGAVTFPIASVFTSGFQSNGAINVGVDDTGYDVKFFGATASAFMQWDASADDLILGGAAGLSVNSAALVTGVLTTTAATVFNGGFAANAASTITETGNNNTLTLSSTDADANAGPNLLLFRDSGSAADSDRLATITYRGKNDAAQNVDYIVYDSFISDASDGSEDASLDIRTILAGSEASRIALNPTETVINESSNDLDFRVESNGNANMLFVDGGNDHVSIGTATDNGGVLNVSSTDNTDTLVVYSSDADANAGPIIRLWRNSGSPADNDGIGAILFSGEDDADAKTDYASIESFALDVTNGTEDGELTIYTVLAGAKVNRLDFNSTETVINESSNDLDFRVESNGNANMLFVDGGENRVGVGTNAPQELLHVYSTAGAAIRASGVGNVNSKVEIGYDNTTGAYIKSGSSNVVTLQFYVDNTSLAMSISALDVISGDFNDTSDVALKENITDLESATTKLKQLKPRTFDWKKTDKGKGVAGFIAQEVETVIPKAVVGTNYENYGDVGKAINATALLAYAVKTIQELEARITALEG